jgi:hypothetical protein
MDIVDAEAGRKLLASPSSTALALYPVTHGVFFALNFLFNPESLI